MSTAIYAGSFDPIHNGHISIIEEVVSAGIFERVVVALGVNPEKENSGMFHTDKRMFLVRSSLAHLESVEVTSFSGPLVTHMAEVGADAIIKGLREIGDLESEKQQAYFNRRLGGRLTFLVPSLPEFDRLSSSMLKAVAKLGFAIDEWVPPVVAEHVYRACNIAPPDRTNEAELDSPLRRIDPMTVARELAPPFSRPDGPSDRP